MEKTLIYALHGFLGKASDWNSVIKAAPEFEFVCGEMFGPEKFSWPDFSGKNQRKIFLGYSLGGRLGLKAMVSASDAFDHYVFISTNPGFTATENELRLRRLKSDGQWAQKIDTGSWHEFVKEWNAQPVFQTGLAEPERPLADFDRSKLKLALLEHSLALQPDYRDLIQTLRDRITWVVGSRDSKYCDLAKDLEIATSVVESGHRIIFDNPAAIADILKKL